MRDGSITAKMAAVMLRQLGAASVVTLPSHIGVAKFEISSEYVITYMYEVRETGGCHLQRTDPYPMHLGETKNEDDLIKQILMDLEKFKMAYNSSNFSTFISLASRMAMLDKKIENLFMIHNVPAEYLKEIDGGLEKIYDLINQAASNSKLL